MPNYNKSFNFRNGVQVDVDDLIVRGNLVGIGTTIPRADLDVHGIVDVTGIVTTRNMFVAGVSTFVDEIHIGTGITISPQTGIISASFRGDASFLDNLPTSQWVDVDPGLGYTSIYNVGPVGVGTTNPIQTLQIGGNPDNPLHFGVGIDSTRGNIRTTGIITAHSFIGSGLGITAITADNIESGTLDTARLPSSFTGLQEVGTVDLDVSGVSTVTTTNVNTLLDVDGHTELDNVNVTGVSTLSQINVTGIATFRDSVTLLDNDKLLFGNNTDLEIFHDTTNNVIQSDTGNLEINIGNSAGNLEINVNNNVAGGTKESSAKFIKNGAVELYHDNLKKFETLGIGATVTGELKVSHHATVLGVSTLTSVSASDATIGVATVTTLNATKINPAQVMVSAAATFSAAVDMNDSLEVDNISLDGNTVTTTSGNLTLDSAGGTLDINDNVDIDGTIDTTGDVTVGGGVSFTGDLYPRTDATSSLGKVDIAFTRGFINEITVGAAASNKISTQGTPLLLDSNQGTVIVQDDLNITGVATVSNVTASTAVTPATDQTSSLGTSALRFSELYVDNIRIGVGSDQEIRAHSGNLELTAPNGSVKINDLMPVGVVTFTSPVLPEGNKQHNLGSVTQAFSEAFVGELTLAQGTNDGTINTRTGELTLDSNENRVIVSAGLSAVSLDVQNNIFVGTGSTSFAIIQSDQAIGIGTSMPTAAVQVVKHSDAGVELISATGNSEVLFARELGNTDDSASIKYNGTDLTIANKDAAGDIKFDLATGSGINTTSNFTVQYGGDDLLLVSHDGKIGVNQSSPTKDVDVQGELLVSGDARISGIVTLGSGANEVTLGSANNAISANIDGDINSVGVSTFATLNATLINTTDLVVNAGLGTFLTGATIGTDAQTAFTDEIGDGEQLTVLGSVSISDNILIGHDGSGRIGIGTTAFPEDDRTGFGNLVLADYGTSFLKGSMAVVGDGGGTAIFVPDRNDTTVPTLKKLNPNSEFQWQFEYRVGINTHVPRTAFDAGACNSPMIVPSLSQQSITNMISNTSDATMTDTSASSGSGVQVVGGLYFSKPDTCLKLCTSETNSENSYARIVHTSMSGSIEAISFPQVSNANVTTLQNDGNIPDGTVVYNTGSNKLQVKASGTFTDLH